nr:MAG TPA: hypothetical protein [Caudoviricetes sp.]
MLYQSDSTFGCATIILPSYIQYIAYLLHGLLLTVCINLYKSLDYICLPIIKLG